MVKTLGEAYSLSWLIRMRCARRPYRKISVFNLLFGGLARSLDSGFNNQGP